MLEIDMRRRELGYKFSGVGLLVVFAGREGAVVMEARESRFIE
jgi:hypothetical protein